MLIFLKLAAGCIVVQLRLVFVPNHTDAQTLRIPLAYVQPFRFSHKWKGLPDSCIKMYSLIRDYKGGNVRRGLIVPLDRIWRPVELIPKFGNKCNKSWTCNTAVEFAKEFYLNCFADKETYIEVY